MSPLASRGSSTNKPEGKSDTLTEEPIGANISLFSPSILVGILPLASKYMFKSANCPGSVSHIVGALNKLPLRAGGISD